MRLYWGVKKMQLQNRSISSFNRKVSRPGGVDVKKFDASRLIFNPQLPIEKAGRQGAARQWQNIVLGRFLEIR